jgi:hypothetical protein
MIGCVGYRKDRRKEKTLWLVTKRNGECKRKSKLTEEMPDSISDSCGKSYQKCPIDINSPDVTGEI